MDLKLYQGKIQLINLAQPSHVDFSMILYRIMSVLNSRVVLSNLPKNVFFLKVSYQLFMGEDANMSSMKEQIFNLFEGEE